MQFRLHYRGPLHSNADAKRKHAIRRVFHRQLAVLWESRPLSAFREYYWSLPGAFAQLSRERKSLSKEGTPFTFIPLVTEHIIASLQITWLRPGLLGSLVSKSGDIDNRLKTLFDALRVPENAPPDDTSDEPERTIYCLLDDDALITEVEVITDRLLEPGVEEMEVEMILAVSLRSSELGLPQGTQYPRFLS